ncbi:hypothetical protein [Hyalangium rubrum]|uniref:Lipoprotein n=1 Tax=Hyalangium rubrum TaxID=3103134 RepID=A0ABU5HGU8_9BACT|nr:hypothetical protein [Hyalangium sp. s54d21]MDY7232063.1 hypothetical protein [Hyalangium sp. s54d21]
MGLRQVGALLLAVLTACVSAQRGAAGSTDPYEAELAALRYEVRVLTAGAVHAEPLELDEGDFQSAMRELARNVQSSSRPSEAAHWLMEGGLEANLLAEVDCGRVVRMVPVEEGSALDASSAARMTREYLRMCAVDHAGSDCLGLLADGPTLGMEDRRTLALAMAFGSVLQEMKHALVQMADPRAVLALVVWTSAVYLTLWLLPEPISKGIAAVLTVALVAWLGMDTVWSLMNGWARLVQEADRATRFEHLRDAGERFGKVMGENTARGLVLLVTAALGGTTAKLAEKLPTLPGFARAAAQAEAQGGMRLAAAGEVEAVAAPAEGTFTLMVRSPGGRGVAASVETRVGVATVIRHQGGNRQVFINGQRWHVPAGKSVKEIPAADPVGDQLQAAAQRVAGTWSRQQLTPEERTAIRRASEQGKDWLSHLLERQARGRFVENEVKDQFRHLRWSKTGVDAVDPVTGCRYELLSGTDSNLALHGRRLADAFFRMITF